MKRQRNMRKTIRKLCFTMFLIIGMTYWPMVGVNAYTDDKSSSFDHTALIKSIVSGSQIQVPITTHEKSNKTLISSQKDLQKQLVNTGNPNLIVNGDFESDPNYNGSWEAFDYAGNNAVFTWDDQTYHGNSGYSLSIEGNAVDSALVNNIPIKPGKAYSFDAWAKALDVTTTENESGVCIYIGQYDNGGNLITGTDNYFTQKDTFDWQNANLNFVSNPNAKSVFIILFLEGSGKVWFDDISLLDMGDIPVTRPMEVVADPGLNRSTYKGFNITLDGSKSITTPGTTLTYNWSFESQPVGSQCVITNSDTANPSFTPDVAGYYTLLLTVDNGEGGTDTRQVEVEAKQFNDIYDNEDYGMLLSNYLPQNYITGYTVSDMIALADGWVIICDSIKKQVLILNTITGELSKTYQLTAPPTNIDFDFDNGIIVATQNGTDNIAWIDVNTDTISYITTSSNVAIDGNSDVVFGNNNIVFSLLNKWPNSSVSIIDITQNKEITSINTSSSYMDLHFMAYDRNGNNLIIGDSGTSPSKLIKYAYDDLNHTLNPLQSNSLGANGQSLALSNDCNHIAFCCGGGNGAGYTIFDIDSSDITNKFGEWNTGAYPTSAVFSLDNKYLLATNRSDIKLFDVGTHNLINTVGPTSSGLNIYKVAISRGSYIGYAFFNGKLSFFKTLYPTAVAPPTVKSVAISGGSLQAEGTNIDVNGDIGGGLNNYYHFWVYDGTNWNLQNSYALTPGFHWTPQKSGRYFLVVEAKDKNSSNNYDSYNVAQCDIYMVPSSVIITGAISITIPSSGNTTSQYSAVVKDINGISMSGQNVTWSLDSQATGVSIDNNTGVVSVDNTAQPGSITVKASSGAVTGSYNITLTRADSVVNTISVSGSANITIPASGSTTSTYTALVNDQYGSAMNGQSLIWSLGSSYAGVGINSSTGVVTVNSTAQPGTINVKAAVGVVSDSYSVNLARAVSVVTRLDINGAGNVAIPLSGSTTSMYTATVKDQYGSAITGETVAWSLGSPVSGVSINSSTGVVTIDNTAQPGTISVNAVDGSVSNTYSVTLSRDSAISPTTASFDKNSSAQADITVTLNFNGNTLNTIKKGDANLNSGSDYSVLDNIITIRKEYLSNLPTGNVTLTFCFSTGKNIDLNISISDSTPTANPDGGGGNVPGGGGGTPAGGVPSDAGAMGGTNPVPDNGTITIEPIHDSNIAKTDITSTAYKELLDSTTTADGIKNITINLNDTGLSEYDTQLPSSALTDSTKDTTITINTAVAKVTLPSNMFIGTEVQSTQNIGINVASVDRSALPASVRNTIGNSPIVEINATVDGNVKAWSNPDAPVTVSIPYTLQNGESSDNITVYYIDGAGNLVNMQGVYDPATKMVTFTTTHFSKYLVKNNEVLFSDLKGYESYTKYIKNMASKDIITGEGNNRYAPGKVLTRAEFATLLVKMLKLNTSVNNVFVDVKVSDWFAPYVNAAYKAGLINGVGGKRFAPNDSITMQDAAIILVKALKFKGVKTTAGNLSGIKDNKGISSYAADAVGFSVQNGIIPLDSKGNFNAKSKVNKALAAEYIYKVFHFKNNIL